MVSGIIANVAPECNQKKWDFKISICCHFGPPPPVFLLGKVPKRPAGGQRFSPQDTPGGPRVSLFRQHRERIPPGCRICRKRQQSAADSPVIGRKKALQSMLPCGIIPPKFRSPRVSLASLRLCVTPTMGTGRAAAGKQRAAAPDVRSKSSWHALYGRP